jgi:hypothetical protein
VPEGEYAALVKQAAPTDNEEDRPVLFGLCTACEGHVQTKEVRQQILRELRVQAKFMAIPPRPWEHAYLRIGVAGSD